MTMRLSKRSFKSFAGLAYNLPGLALLVVTLTGAYSIVYMGTYAVTSFTVVAIIALVAAVFNPNQIVAGFMKNPFGYLMIVLMMVSYIVGKQATATALALSCMYFLVYAASFRAVDTSYMQKWLQRWQIVMNVLAIYAFYQLIGRSLGLPFTDLYFEGHMVEGYNWTNPVIVAGNSLMRSNAVFLEPSFFSQFLAINILIYAYRLLNEDAAGSRLRHVLCMLLNLGALITTFSGTGIVVLLIGAVAILFYMKDGIARAKIAVPAVLCGIAVLIGFLLFAPESLISYFAERASELLSYSDNAGSGYKRFNGSYQIALQAIEETPLFGTGIGGVRGFVSSLGDISFADSNNYVSNGFVRVAVELGVPGLFLWCCFLGKAYFNKKKEYGFGSLICLVSVLVISLNFCHEVFSGIYFWAFFCFLNTALYEDNKGDCA